MTSVYIADVDVMILDACASSAPTHNQASFFTSGYGSPISVGGASAAPVVPVEPSGASSAPTHNQASFFTSGYGSPISVGGASAAPVVPVEPSGGTSNPVHNQSSFYTQSYGNPAHVGTVLTDDAHVLVAKERAKSAWLWS
jgi:hypothetical protein